MITWAFQNIIHDQTNPRSKAAQKIQRGTQTSCASTAGAVSSVIVGAIAQLPFAYLAYTYNDGALYMPALILLTDTWVPAYSFYLTLKLSLHVRKIVKTNTELIAIQAQMIKLFQKSQEILPKKGRRTAAFLDKLKEIRASNNEDRSVEYACALFN
ncbi:MAG: hypothetical protein S4CHLAM45_14150 [Chlamydiales bacterium]|nr:hypothetical protein [Chlamydiales bacterium]MCH9620076.1 hypothetical protein [Chlamydiales bacterium]MCH9623505.1 hypothetical protein [Chlamydiales bacterium]